MSAPELLKKREKTWFFPLCGYLAKINNLIFLVYFLRFSVTSPGCLRLITRLGRLTRLIFFTFTSGFTRGDFLI
jgi:hypothetical protein